MPLSLPSDPTLPLFVYGLLRPGEPAHPQIEPFVARQAQATAAGVLHLRDGLPLFDPSGSQRAHGDVLWFHDDALEQAWEAVVKFEPGSQYRWEAVRVRAGGQSLSANVLFGRKLHKGTAGETVAEWSARFDPVLVEGLEEVRCLVLEIAPYGVESQPDRPELWRQFFRLQATYLLLWSVVERYTALRFGPALGPTARIERLGDDPAFRAAVLAVGARLDVVVDGRNPEVSHRLGSDGEGAADYFQAVRSNLSHRGKGAFRDARLVLKATVELHDAIRVLLSDQVPSLDEPWRRLAGTADRVSVSDHASHQVLLNGELA